MAPLLAGCALTATPTAAKASCNLDYGEKLLDWVNDDAARQSRQLATADYNARAFNGFLIGFEDAHERTAATVQRLDRIAAAIAEAERQISAISTASESRHRDLVAAILRDESAVHLLEDLAAARAEIAAIDRLHGEMMRDPTKESFRAKGLQNVGRATLIASLQEMGDLTQLALADRYGFYVGATFGEDGSIQGGGDPAIQPEMYDHIVLALASYTGPYAPFIYAAYVMVRLSWHQEECRRARKEQDELVEKASRRLPSMLIQPEQQFKLYDETFRRHRTPFEQHSAALTKVEGQMLERWRALYAYNSERAAAAKTVLTTARVEEVRRRTGSDPELAMLFENLGRARIARDIGNLARHEALSERAALRACHDVGGLKSVERLQDTIRYADETYKTFQQQAAFATLHGALEQRRQASAAATRRAAALEREMASRSCDEALTAQSTAKLFEGLETNQLAEPVSKFMPLLMRASAASKASASVSNLEFCRMWRSGGLYSCGGGGGGGPYSDQVGPSSGGGGVMERAHDGGYRADRRISAGIDGVRANVETRIVDLNNNSAGPIAALPHWLQGNGPALETTFATTQDRTTEDLSARMTFVSASAPATAQAREALDVFLEAPASSADGGALARTIGSAQQSLPDLPVSDIPPDVPPVTGITAPRRAYGDNATRPTSEIEYERRKLEEALPNDTPSRRRAKEALDTAARFATQGARADVIDALITDAAAERFHAAGELPIRTIAVVDADGVIRRVPLLNSDVLPRNSLLARARDFQSDQIAIGMRYDAALRQQGTVGLPGNGAATLALADRTRLAAAAKFYDDPVGGQVGQELAKPLIDIAVSFSPLGWPRDIYEALSGRDAVSGEELDTFGYTAAVFGVLTFGGGKPIMKAIGEIRPFIESTHSALDVERIFDAATSIDQGVLEFTSRHAIERLDTTRRFADDVLEDTLNTGTRFWDVKHDSIVVFQNGVDAGELRAGVAVNWRNMSVNTVIEEARTNDQLLRVGHTIDDVFPPKVVQRFYPLEETDDLDDLLY